MRNLFLEAVVSVLLFGLAMLTISKMTAAPMSVEAVKASRVVSETDVEGEEDAWYRRK